MAPSGAAQRHILCMKWGTKYGPEYVNRLYAMVRRHLTGNFNFVCLTDDSQGIRPEVQCLPIPSLDLNLAPGQRDGAWKKLTTFTGDLHGLRGTALFLDVDVVIVGSLDNFFTQPGEFLIIRDYPRFWRFGKRITGNSSVYRFQLGAHADVLANFRAHLDDVQATYRNEQAYLSDYLHKQGKLGYWPEGWCPSFKYHGIPLFPANLWREPFVPEGARIVIFHGECNPPDALAGRRNRLFRYIRPARWIAKFWKE
ncbi:glycosyltransferase [Variovorax sp. PAMC 28711]|uniref:glycosyltransferase n=1 Tax=Variovorax sp. PAMC 28711 TaxID=1795631 RepID=UPI00078BA489|nr:glycosyltransferase [Variovorax sp. PAMC 28711]AMM26188.1 glycosyltransferase [Variovorax sp. PAMC 28711]